MSHMELDTSVILFLLAASFSAGFVDAIAGGGGMLTIPALLMAGIPPTHALGTNKLQACFGSFSATLFYLRRGMLKPKLLPMILTFAASAIGTLCVQVLGNSALSTIIPFLLIAFGLYFLFSPKISHTSAISPKPALLFIALFAIGFYDGFFGPGTGSFLMLALILLGAHAMLDALAHAKLYNFMTNLASLLFFALLGNVLFSVGLLMGAGQFCGGYLGSKVASNYGAKIIKPLIVTISLAVSLKLIIEQYWL